MPTSISRDLPLNEITLRRYEKPYEMPRRELVRKLCLSLGVLQPGDSRDVIVDVLHVLLQARDKKKFLNSEEVRDEAVKLRKKQKLPLKGIASSNIRRQLKRLKDLSIVENIKNAYRITEFDELSTIFEQKLEKYYLQNILARVKDYCKALK